LTSAPPPPLPHPRFFVSIPLPRSVPLPALFTLDDNAAMHMRVLRLAAGETITLFDGLGGEFTASIVTVGKRDALVNLLEHQAIERESALNITLVQALATGDKMDWIIQKATELGVAAIEPIQTQRATAKLNAERAEKRALHWQGVAVAACEQCGRNRIPRVAPLLELPAWLARSQHANSFILHPGADVDLLTGLRPYAHQPQGVTLLIGPEGGFAPEEVAAALRAGVQALRFGPRVLRTETAGLAALAALQSRFGDLMGDL
jgi:16S rRNA (uracil1498-N3)-methyltransferase